MSSIIILENTNESIFIYYFRDGLRESHVVTKTFDVEYVPMESGQMNEDGLGFINDIPSDLVKKYNLL